ncbi:hypothetical protein [Haladaptatus sp. NG-SE-30]
MTFQRYLSTGVGRVEDLLPLAVVPLFATFLHVDNVRKVIAAPGLHFGVNFRFPTSIPTFWTFASVPNPDSGVFISPTLFFAPIFILLESALAAGYLGSVRDGIETGSFDFVQNIRSYFLPLLGYTLLVWLVQLLMFALGLLFFPLLLVGLVAMLVLAYWFYGAPYLVVVADLSLDDALRRSYDLATTDSAYFEFGTRYLVFVLVVSVIGTLFVNLGIIGIVVGAVLAAPVSLALSVATVSFFLDHCTTPEY